jgi:2OG-Fe(II) oxygenase superfamily
MAPRRRPRDTPSSTGIVASKATLNVDPCTVREISRMVISPAIYPTKSEEKHLHSRKSQKKPAAIMRELSLRARPLYRGDVWVIDNFMTADECRAWAQFADEASFEEAQHPATRDTAFRDNGRIESWDLGLADRIWTRLEPFVPGSVDSLRAIGCFEKIRFYRYKAGGQRFGKHIDESVDGTQPGTSTKLTVLIYLNGPESGLSGGETVFYRGAGHREAVRFMPAAGTLLYHGYATFPTLWAAHYHPSLNSNKFVVASDRWHRIRSLGNCNIVY